MQSHAPALPSPSGGSAGRIRAWARAVRVIHPFPTLLNVGAVAGLAVVAEGGVPDGWLLARMLVAMLCAQSAIGAANDYFDRELDAASKPWKPIVAGVVSPRAALGLSMSLSAIALALVATIGWASLALFVVGLGAGLAYDVRLKRTMLSAVPYMVAIPTLPLWVWASLGAWETVLWWIVPLGALVGISLHVANTLPDIDADRAGGVVGFAHMLGRRFALVVAWGAFSAALGLALALTAVVSYELRLLLPSVGVGAAALVVAVGAYAWRRDEAALQVGFGALGIGAAVVATGWLAAAT